MGRFLAIYHGAADETAKAEITEQQQSVELLECPPVPG
jgi:hypothetical protein